MYDYLAENNIYVRKYFYPIVPDYECYKELYKEIKLPIAKQSGDRVITLPIYHELSLEDVDRVCSFIKDFFK